MHEMDWYDYKAIEKFNEKRSRQWLRLYKKLKDAKESGDEEAIKEAKQALIKHQQQDLIYKKKASETGYYWV